MINLNSYAPTQVAQKGSVKFDLSCNRGGKCQLEFKIEMTYIPEHGGASYGYLIPITFHDFHLAHKVLTEALEQTKRVLLGLNLIPHDSTLETVRDFTGNLFQDIENYVNFTKSFSDDTESYW